ncbi:MAG: membrane protein insertase YidC, partial [Candidatus Hydrogenedentes bacterium]|nr:membrane protein insertase YidC [Candidatus Hydrogenedentota bacterium]
MIEDEQEKAAARNQLIAIFLMMGLALVYFNFFAPTPSPPTQTPTDAVPAGQQTDATPSDVLRADTAAEQVETADATGWPNLPPPAEDVDPATDDIVIENDDLRLVFTRIGARLKNAYVLLHENGEDEIQLIPAQGDASDLTAVYPFGLRFSNEELRDELDYRRFDVVERSDRSITFGLTLPETAEIRKTFTFDEASHVLDVNVEYRNLEAEPRVLGMDQEPAFIVNWGPNVDSHDLKKGVRQTLIWRVAGANDWTATAKMEPGGDGEPFVERISSPEWMGVKSAYFMVAMKPEFSPSVGWVTGTEKRFRFGVGAPRAQIEPGETLSATVRASVGPN